MPKQFKSIIILSSSIILFSLIAFLTNTFIFQYIGNNYFPPNSLNAAIILFLSYLGFIGLPSFHVIWAWLCLYLIRSWRIAFFLLMPINGLIVLACILLGWHFPTDLLGSLVVLLLAHRLLIMQRSSTKWGETGRENHSTIQQISIQNHTVV